MYVRKNIVRSEYIKRDILLSIVFKMNISCTRGKEAQSRQY